MPVPSPRNSIRIARGNYADLAANITEIGEGELCFAIDQDRFYSKAGGSLVPVGGGTELYSINQLGDVSTDGALVGEFLAWNGSAWVPEPGQGQLTGAEIKALYEAQPNTNAYTDPEKAKLAGIEDGAQVNDPVDLGASFFPTSVVIGSSTGNGINLTAADATQAGVMTAADRIKLDGIEPGAEVNLITSINGQTGDITIPGTDLGQEQAEGGGIRVTSSTGDDVVIPLADVINDGLMEGGDKAKLNGIEVGAQRNIKSDWNAFGSAAEILNKPDLSLKADLVNGVIPTSQIPVVAITEFLGNVASEAEMIALVGQPGDWCFRSDEGFGYVVVAEPSSNASNWQQMATPGGDVNSVNGQTGTVVLSAADVGAIPAGDAPSFAPSTIDLQAVTDNGNTTTNGATFADGDISLNANGSASFSGNVTTSGNFKADGFVQSVGDPRGGVEEGSMMSGSTVLTTGDGNAATALFVGRVVGSSDPVFKVTGDGGVTAKSVSSEFVNASGATGNYSLFEAANTADIDSTTGFYSAYSGAGKSGGQLFSFLSYPRPVNGSFTAYTGFSSNLNTGAGDAAVNNSVTAFYDFKSSSGGSNFATYNPNATFYGYYVSAVNSQFTGGAQQTYAFYSDGNAPSFLQGDTYIGGTAASPNIELNSDGLITADRVVIDPSQAGPQENTSNGMYIHPISQNLSFNVSNRQKLFLVEQTTSCLTPAVYHILPESDTSRGSGIKNDAMVSGTWESVDYNTVEPSLTRDFTATWLSGYNVDFGRATSGSPNLNVGAVIGTRVDINSTASYNNNAAGVNPNANVLNAYSIFSLGVAPSYHRGNIYIGGSVPSHLTTADPDTTAKISLKSDGGGSFAGTVNSSERTIGASWDLSTGNFWYCSGGIAVPNPVNATTGTSGLIRLAAAPIGWGSNIKHPGGSAEVISNFPAMVPFYVQDANTILLGKATQGIA